MPLIITATDFSAVAENAANYACQLAAAQNAQLTIIHSFVFPVMFSDIPMPATLINDAQNDSEQQMQKLVIRLKTSYPDVEIQGLVIDGNIISAMEKYAKENSEPWLVVLGNRTISDHSSWDSILLEAFKDLQYPVLAVPATATWSPVKKICFAFDNKHEGNDAALVQLRDIALSMKAELHVLNAQEDVLNRDNLPPTDETAQKILAPANPHFHTVYEVNIDDAIEDFTRKNNIDWLVMIPRKYSFFEGLFHKSHSQAIAHRTSIPIVALHENHA